MALAVAKKLNGVVRTRAPLPTPERHQREDQRIGARSHADGVRDAAVGCHRRLEALEVRTQGEPLRRQHLGHRFRDRGAHLGLDGGQIEEGNAHAGLLAARRALVDRGLPCPRRSQPVP